MPADSPNQPADTPLHSLPDLFLLHPANRAFLAGRSDSIHIPVNWKRYKIGVGVALALATVVLLALPAGWFLGLLALSAITLSVATVRRLRCTGRLARDGRLLKGELVALFVEKNFGESERHYAFSDKLGYTYLAPDGRRLYGKEVISMSARYPDKQPRSGLRVAIIYIDEHCYRML